MNKIQFLTFLKNPKFILFLILIVFFLKGVFLAAIFPIFVGQDEARHYSSVQYLSESRPITWPLIERAETEKNTILRYNYSQESRETAKAVDWDKANDNLYSTSAFVDGYDGKNEKLIKNSDWHQYNEYTVPNTAGKSLYHRLASIIEKKFSDQDIFTRYYLIRFFSVFLGVLTILFSYLIAKNIGFSAKHSLLLTAIIAFQPRLSIYYSAINYDSLLILTFTLFTLGSVLVLKNGPGWKNILLIIISIYVGTQTKPTAYLMIISAFLLAAFLLYKKFKDADKRTKYTIFSLVLFSTVFLLIYFVKRFVGAKIPNDFFDSIIRYLDKSLTMGRFGLSSRTYWGALTWVNSWLLENVTDIIWIIQFFATAGLGWLFFSKKPKPDFLPEKKYILFLLAMIVVLQVGIRAADWSVFRGLGSLDLGTPGRYFLPNITAHIILVFVGIGAFLDWVLSFQGKSNLIRKYFGHSLIIGLILMMAFMLYLVFDVIIFRYYL